MIWPAFATAFYRFPVAQVAQSPDENNLLYEKLNKNELLTNMCYFSHNLTGDSKQELGSIQCKKLYIVRWNTFKFVVEINIDFATDNINLTIKIKTKFVTELTNVNQCCR